MLRVFDLRVSRDSKSHFFIFVKKKKQKSPDKYLLIAGNPIGKTLFTVPPKP